MVIGDDDRIFTEPGNKGARDRMAGGDIPNLKGGGQIPGILITLDDQGGGSINWNYSELSPSLRAQTHGHPPTVVLENG